MRATPLLLLPLLACGTPAPSAPPPPRAAAVPVEAVEIALEELVRPIRVTGVLAPKDEQRLSFKLGGVLERVAVEEGELVRRGQPLASLALAEIDAQVAQAELGVAKARRDLTRVEQLGEAIARSVREDAETAARLAEHQLEIARFNRAHAVITAPASGRVERRLASAGELVAPGQPILVIGATERGWVLRASVTDKERVRLALQDRGELHFDALGDAAVAASVSELASAPSPLTGGYEVELAVRDASPALVSGLFGRGVVTPAASERVLRVPPAALLEADGDRGAVYVVEGGSVRRAHVVLGPIVGERVVVLEGLEPGARVVVAGAAYLADGAQVVVRAPGAMADAR